jgi:sugar/nucleoside kinase (ribokinase family)
MLIGKIGDDLFGRTVIEILRQHADALAEGMIVAEGESSSYTIVISPPGADRIFLHSPGTNDTFHADEISIDRLGGARLFHFGYPPLMRKTFEDGGHGLARLFEEVRSLGLAVSLDMAKPDPNSRAGRADWKSWLQHVLPHVDIFGPSIGELLFMLDRPLYDHLTEASGDENLISYIDGQLLQDLSARLLEMGVAIVLIKLGSEGLFLCTTPDAERLAAVPGLTIGKSLTWQARTLLQPCFQVHVAGTTGSGDCTLAGFLASLLRNRPPEKSLRCAVAVGACSVERQDSTSGIPAWRVIRKRIASGWPQHASTLALNGWRWADEQGLWTAPGDLVPSSLIGTGTGTEQGPATAGLRQRLKF